MNAIEIHAKLQDLKACTSALHWSKGKSLAEIWTTCERGDWMLWLAARAKVDKRKLTAAKADCAETVKHLMKDPRSIKALETAQAYGRGEATDQELADAANDAYTAANDAYTAACAADACYAAATAYAADAAYACAADACYAAATAAKIQSRKRNAGIVRSHISITDLNL